MWVSSWALGWRWHRHGSSYIFLGKYGWSVGPPKTDGCREKPKFQFMGHNPQRGCPNQFANCVAIFSLIDLFWFCLTSQNLPRKVSCPCRNSELSVPKRHPPVTGTSYKSVLLDQQPHASIKHLIPTTNPNCCSYAETWTWGPVAERGTWLHVLKGAGAFGSTAASLQGTPSYQPEW